METKKHFFSMRAAMMLLMMVCSLGAWAQETSGYCGDNVTWTFDGSTLTISGTGAMADYDWQDDRPWNDFRYDISTVIIGDGVTSIGNNAFGYCIVLESVTFAAGSQLEAIGESAFQSAGLTSITIPASVTSIGDNAFNDCFSLPAINVADENTTYSSENGILFNKEKTTLIVCPMGNPATAYAIPATVTTIGESAFKECSNLTSVTIPASVTSIGKSAFAMCDDLTSVTFAAGSQLEAIGESAFQSAGLTSITIPASVTSIWNNAFNDCVSLPAINVAEGNTTYSSENGILFNKDKTTLIVCPNGNPATAYAIPATVTSIGESAFEGCGNLTSVTIPASVTSIGRDAFWYCQNLVSVIVNRDNPPTLTHRLSFNGNASGRKFYVPSGSVDDYKGDTNWSNYTSDIEAIPTVANGTCGTDVTWELTGPEGNYTLTISGPGAMANYNGTNMPWNNYKDNISTVIIGDGVTSIGNRACYQFDNLATVTIAASVTRIGVSAFYECAKLATVSGASGVTDAGRRDIFEGTAWLKNLPDGLTYVGHVAYIFKGYGTSVELNAGTTQIAESAFYDSQITSITIPAGVTSIGAYAFAHSALTSVIIPASVTSIGTYAFEDLALTSVIIPASVTSIGAYAFAHSALQKIYSLATSAPSFGGNVFDGCPNLTDVIVPATPATAYNSYSSWFGGNPPETLKPGYTVTCDEGITTTAGPLVVEGEPVTLAYSGTVPEGNIFYYTVDDSPIEGSSFEMPDDNVTVSAVNAKNIAACNITVPNQTLERFGGGDPYPYIYFKFEAAENNPTSNVIGEVVKDGETTLTLGTDYEFGQITFAEPSTHDEKVNPCKPGDKCRVEIIGLGTYVGTAYADFTIISPSANGTYGDLSWSVADGTLSITGTGAMTAAATNGYPWYQYCSIITTISIGDGVTSIADNAFGSIQNIYTYNNVAKVTIPASVSSIGADAFKGCITATDVYCYADPTNLTWDDTGDDFKSGKETTCHVADESAWNSFSSVNVAFEGDLAEKSIPYIDADGNMAYCTDFTVIDRNNGNAGWYVVKGNVSKENGDINFTGEAHIILADGATLTLSNGTLRGYSHLTIYGQAAGTGTLNATKTDGFGIQTKIGGNLTINGGIINATGGTKAIDVGGNLVINGGTVTGTSESNMYGLYAGGTITINGGQVTATGDIHSEGDLAINGGQVTATGMITTNYGGDITLGWTNSTDIISASQILTGYDANTVSIADGKAFTDGTNVYTSATPSATLKALTDVTLQPVTGVTLTDDGSGNLTAEFDGTSLATLSIPGNVKVNAVNFGREFTEGVPVTLMLPFSLADGQTITGGTLYKFSGISKNSGTGIWEATMTESATLHANTPYLLMPNSSLSSGNSGTLTFGLNSTTVTLNTTTAGETSSTDADWEFKGSYEERHWYDGTDGVHAASNTSEIGKVYGFAATSGKATDGVTDIEAGQFVRFANGAWILPTRCYLIYNGEGTPGAGARNKSAAAAGELPDKISVRLIGLNGTTTAIGTLDTKTGELRFGDSWFSLDGTKLDGKPTKKGVYIHGGKKIIKN